MFSRVFHRKRYKIYARLVRKEVQAKQTSSHNSIFWEEGDSNV